MNKSSIESEMIVEGDGYKRHHTAIVDTGAKIGAFSTLWHWVHISGGAEIGEHCRIGQGAFVGNVKIGNRCKLQNNVSVFDGVTLGDDVFCGPSMVFTNVVNPRAGFDRRSEFKPTVVGNGVSFGANSTVICGTTLGDWCFIAAGAVVTKDVKPFALMVGVPARQVGWMSRFGEKLDLPLAGNGSWTCNKTGDRYELTDANLVLFQS